MSENVLKVMKNHLASAEKYVEAMKLAASAEDCAEAMKNCADEVRGQYAELENIKAEFISLMDQDIAGEELKSVCFRAGECFGREIALLMPKMAGFMNDDVFKQAQADLDDALMNNPLFEGHQSNDEALIQAASGFAGAMTAVSDKIRLETEGISGERVQEIAGVINSLTEVSGRFNKAVAQADTPRKFVKSCELFITAVKKLIPEMNSYSDDMRALAAGKELPASITLAGQALNKALGLDLKETLKDKQELMADKNVRKSVKKLGEVLDSVPF